LGVSVSQGCFWSYNSAVRRSAAIATFSVVIVAVTLARASELEERLRYEFRDKTLVLRGFYPGRDLHYDSTGALLEASASGDWTINGIVRIEDISISGSRLRIKASREHWGWVNGFSPVHDFDGKGQPDKDEKKNRAVEIEADLGADITVDRAEAAVSRIFLSSNDSFADLVPAYWKPCVKAALQDSSDLKLRSCRFSTEFLQIPGVQTPSSVAQSSGISSADTPPSERALVMIGHGVSPPKVLNQHEPSFSEPARKSKFQGTVTLGLIVDRSGNASNVHVLTPLGCGLDEEAVRTVETWKFEPAEKDGNPVAIEIAVEVDFHLF
jgi:TonB family protein